FYGALGIELLHPFAGLLWVPGHFAFVKVRREGDEVFLSQAAGDVLDVVVQTPPLLDDQDTGAGARASGASVKTGSRTSVIERIFDGAGLNVFFYHGLLLRNAPRSFPILADKPTAQK